MRCLRVQQGLALRSMQQLLGGIGVCGLLFLAVSVYGATPHKSPAANSKPALNSAPPRLSAPASRRTEPGTRQQVALPLRQAKVSSTTALRKSTVRPPPLKNTPPIRRLEEPRKSAAAPYRQRVLHGTVRGSLYRTLLAQGGTARLVDDLVDIFSLDLDFRTAIRSGDTVRLLLEEQSRGGKFLYRRILAAEVRTKPRMLQAVYYPEDDAYYRPDGRSLERMFLSAPVRSARISSAFSHRRLHPVLKYYRPHLGIDYAAPTGTPVLSVGDGVVTWAGMKGGNGQMVEIRHDGTYSTYYLHLSRIAHTLRVGTAVEQGQVIGYVGATGLATGPHLDFRLTRNGSFLNPIKHQDIAAPAIAHEERPAFQAYARRLMARLDRPGVVSKK